MGHARRAGIRLVVVLGVAASSLLAVTVAAAEPGLGGTARIPTPASGRTLPYWYAKLACPAAGDCVAAGPPGLVSIGEPSASAPLAVGTEAAGAWGKPRRIAAPAGGAATSTDWPGVRALSCPDVGDCTAVGGYATTKGGAYGPIAVSETAGSWGGASFLAQPVAAAGGGAERGELDAVDCLSAASCVAVGDVVGTGGLSRADADVETAGSWGPATMLPAIPGEVAAAHVQVAGVECSDLGDCQAAASDGGAVTDVWTETAGSWSEPVVVRSADGRFQASALACPSPTTCLLVGRIEHGTGSAAAVATETDGTWSTAVALALPRLSPVATSAYLSGLSCASALECVAVGAWQIPLSTSGAANAPLGSRAGAVTWSSGRWSSVGYLPVPVPKSLFSFVEPNGVSCPTTASCTAMLVVLSLGIGGFRVQQLAATVRAVRPVGTPGPPVLVAGVGLLDGLRATWHPPTDDGGSPVRAYTVTLQPGDRTCSTRGDACTFRHLLDTHRYHLVVRDDTSFGASRPAQALVAAGPVPTRPTAVRAHDQHGTVKISWRPATAPRDEPVHYVVTIRGGQRLVTVVTSVDHCSVPNLRHGGYWVTVTAVDPSGESVPSPRAHVHVARRR